ncbi:MAG: hypothetical protein JSV65_08315 [Armatimonadota bacterium]|nr:MAG: hypothetical protein JSV65_08315 [Armatimonadota bacterium]
MARILSLILIVSVAGLAGAATEPLLGPDQIMPTSEIRAGMIATGKSVFRGTDIEEFHLEILGVAEKARGGTDVILAQVLDGTLIERESGILQGMSGSPVYVGERLIGAIAFTWPFSKEPVAGITPIEDMLRVLAAGVESEPTPATAALAEPVVVGGRAVHSIRILDASSSLTPDWIEPVGTLTLRPVSSVFLGSGMSQRGLDRLRQVVEPYGAAVTQGVGGSSQLAGETLEPGSALGIQLVRGDFDVTAIGTVTCVIGDKVLALGHPMMSMGEIDLPMTGAYIQTIVPGYAMSMKMGVAGKPVGRIGQDRMWAVAGVTGQDAQTIPIAVTIEDAARDISQSFNAQIARHRLLSPGLAATVALSAIDRAWERIGEGTAQVTVEITGPQRVIRRTDTAFSPRDAAAGITGELAGPLAVLMDNEFGNLDVKSVRVSARIVPERQTARLERLNAEPGKHKAGEPLKLTVLLRPFKGEAGEKTLTLELPPDLPDGRLRVGVAGGNEAAQLRSMLGLAPRRAFNLEQLVEIYETAERADAVVALAALPSVGVTAEGRRVSALPAYLVELLGDAPSSVVQAERDYLKASLACDWVIQGRQVTFVDVEGKPGAAKARPPRLRPSPTPEGAPEGEEEEGEPVEEAIAALMTMATAAAGPAEAGNDEAQAADGKKEKAKKEEPVARGPSSWTHTKRSDFLPGEFDGIACDEEGVLTLAPQQKTLAKLGEPVISAAVAHDGAIYAATAPGGRVRKLSADGEVQQTWDTGAVIITSLAVGSAGSVLAGAAPGGRILSLAEEGKVEEYWATGEDTVWAMAVAPDGGVYVGTGPNGKVFRVTAGGEGKLLCRLPATNVYALAVAGEALYAGTGNAGVVYAIDAAGQARAVYDSEEASVTCLAVGADGDIFAGTAPGAGVVRLRPGREVELVLRAEGENVAALQASANGSVYAVTASDGVMYEIEPDAKKARVLRKPEAGHAIALALGDEGVVYAGESNPAAIVRVGPGATRRGTFTSEPQKAVLGTRWGAMSCAADVPEGTTARFQTRSGDSADPDDHWSGWSAPSDLNAATPIASPPAGFLQYRIILAAEDPEVSPAARDVQINYLPPNREPTVAFSAPKPADRVRGKVELKWKGRDPDGDTLTYDLSASADGGATWTEIKTGVEDETYSWDTADLGDGAYLVRVMASDELSNPGAAREGETRQVLWVDNAQPTVIALRHTVSVTPEKRATFRGAASDKLSPIRGVDYRVDDGKWRAAAVEGLVGTQQVSFAVETDELSAGEHTIHVRAFDQAGNDAKDEIRVTVEGSTTADRKAKAAEGERQPAPAKAQ